jgi:pyruvate dehydrogenase E1 component beta subunit
VADLTYREALRRALDEELARDEDVFLMGEEIGRFEGSYKVTAGLWQKYGEQRVRETPISEEGFIGAGIGAAMMGLRPVIEIMTINFILVAMDQVINHAAKIRYMFGGTVGVPLVIRAPRRRRRPADRPALPEPGGVVRRLPRAEGGRTRLGGGRLRDAEVGDP